MKRTVFFSHTDHLKLQDIINEWLSANKDVQVIGTNLTSVAIDKNIKHTFYILYTILSIGNQEVVELLQKENILATEEIKPETLNTEINHKQPPYIQNEY